MYRNRPSHLVGVRIRHDAALLAGLVLGTGCADGDTPPTAECGGHGELHEDHCDCDSALCIPE